MTSTTSGITDFTRAMWGDWLTRMSGPFSVPLAVAAFFVTNDIAKILLGLTAFICFWVTAFLLWKHDKVIERDQKRRQLLDQISALRERIVRYRIDIEEAYGNGATSLTRRNGSGDTRICRLNLLPGLNNCHLEPKQALIFIAGILLALTARVARAPPGGHSYVTSASVT
jgi:predicted nucleic acid-binding protein